jgi:hypothetical protein
LAASRPGGSRSWCRRWVSVASRRARSPSCARTSTSASTPERHFLDGAPRGGGLRRGRVRARRRPVTTVMRWATAGGTGSASTAVQLKKPPGSLYGRSRRVGDRRRTPCRRAGRRKAQQLHATERSLTGPGVSAHFQSQPIGIGEGADLGRNWSTFCLLKAEPRRSEGSKIELSQRPLERTQPRSVRVVK